MVRSPLSLANHIHLPGGSSPCEDAWLAEPEYSVYAVIDGATSLNHRAGDAGPTGGFIAANTVADCLRQHLRQRASRSLPLATMLLHANAAIAAAMSRAGIDQTVPENRFSACAVVVRLGVDTIEVAQIGDCLLVILHDDGTVELATPNQLSQVAKTTHRICVEALGMSFQSSEARSYYLREKLKPNRALANQAGGYGVLNGQAAAADFVFTRAFSTEGIRAILLMSDGLAFPNPSTTEDLGVAEALHHIGTYGLEHYAHWLNTLEQADSACRLYPRVKVSDDKTALWITR